MKEINNDSDLNNYLRDEYFLKTDSCHVKIPCTISSNEMLYHNFNYWIFEKDVNFNGEFKNRVEFNNCTFKGNVSFKDVTFTNKVKIFSCQFKSTVNFGNTKFGDLADFWNTSFFKKVIFYKTDFNGITVFAITKFHENVLFTYTLINKVAIFRHTKFNKGLDLSLAIISGSCSFFDIKLENYKTVNDFDEEEKFEHAVSEEGEITINNKRETFRIIKNQLKSQGSNFDAIKYSNWETKVYNKQILDKFFNSNMNLNSYWFSKFKKWILNSLKNKKNIFYKPYGDLFILFFNYISNNHGKSWTRGFLFTIIFGFLFFNLSIIYTDIYLFDIKCNAIGKIEHQFQYFIQFINPTHDIDYLKYFNPTNFFYFYDFFGRLLVGYGIYQTVQAFRKFKS
ncbi:MAG: pentapeptide repeat-containing protein [Flavobacterium sp.]|uniref:pentapeptide repeat-containing protein n=1 Tax=Flavobacterium sp. TaxID=239 RepID=UPI003BDFBC65